MDVPTDTSLDLLSRMLSVLSRTELIAGLLIVLCGMAGVIIWAFGREKKKRADGDERLAKALEDSRQECKDKIKSLEDECSRKFNDLSSTCEHLRGRVEERSSYVDAVFAAFVGGMAGSDSAGQANNLDAGSNGLSRNGMRLRSDRRQDSAKGEKYGEEG